MNKAENKNILFTYWERRGWRAWIISAGKTKLIYVARSQVTLGEGSTYRWLSPHQEPGLCTQACFQEEKGQNWGMSQKSVLPQMCQKAERPGVMVLKIPGRGRSPACWPGPQEHWTEDGWRKDSRMCQASKNCLLPWWWWVLQVAFSLW